MSDEAAVATRTDDGLVARIAAGRQKFKAAATSLAKQRDALKSELDKTKAELDAMKANGDTEGLRARITELEQEKKLARHQAAFNRVAKSKGVVEEALDDLWTLSGYQAESEEPSEAAIGKLIETQKAMPARARLFDIVDPNAPPAPVVKPGIGTGQGKNPGGRDTGFMLPARDDPRWSDPRWQMEHFAEISDAQREAERSGQI